jgi:hypothetical protein
VIELKSPRWSKLRQAYGAATDVPDLLQRLADGDREAIWELYATICHQGTVYSASYAAVPHLAKIASATRRPRPRAEILTLLGSIVAGADRAEIPADLQADYDAALPAALKQALTTLQEPIGRSAAVYLLEVAAALAGRPLPHGALTGFVDEELTLECPRCKRELFLWPTKQGLSTAAEDPVLEPKTPRIPVIPGPELKHAETYRWLMRKGGEAALSLIGARLASLFGAGTCPLCGAPFSVMERLTVGIVSA